MDKSWWHYKFKYPTDPGPLTPEEIKRQKYRSTVRPEAGVNPFVDLLNIDKFKGNLAVTLWDKTMESTQNFDEQINLQLD